MDDIISRFDRTLTLISVFHNRLLCVKYFSGVMTYGRNSHNTQPWLEIEQSQDAATGATMMMGVSNGGGGYPETASFTFTIRTGEITGPLTSNNFGGDGAGTFKDTIELWWACNGRRGTQKLRVKVEVVDNQNMLTFPFSVEEEIVAGTTKEVAFFVFNIAASAKW